MASIHTKRFDKEADSIEIYNPNYDLKIGGGWHDNYKFRIFPNILSTCDLFQVPESARIWRQNDTFICNTDLKHRKDKLLKLLDIKNLIVNEIILEGKYYDLKVILKTPYPLSSINFYIKINKRVEMLTRFGRFYLNRSGLDYDTISKILDYTINTDKSTLSKGKEFIQCKKYLLDYGKSSESVFDYDEKMENSPIKMIGDYIKCFLKLCEKYSYSYKYINNWDIS